MCFGNTFRPVCIINHILQSYLFDKIYIFLMSLSLSIISLIFQRISSFCARPCIVLFSLHPTSTPSTHPPPPPKKKHLPSLPTPSTSELDPFDKLRFFATCSRHSERAPVACPRVLRGMKGVSDALLFPRLGAKTHLKTRFFLPLARCHFPSLFC